MSYHWSMFHFLSNDVTWRIELPQCNQYLQKNTETCKQFCEGLDLEVAFCCCMGSCVIFSAYDGTTLNKNGSLIFIISYYIYIYISKMTTLIFCGGVQNVVENVSANQSILDFLLIVGHIKFPMVQKVTTIHVYIYWSPLYKKNFYNVSWSQME